MFSLAFFFMVLHISAYSTSCLSSAVFIISYRFIIRALVDHEYLDFNGLLIAIATLFALCWIMSVMLSLKLTWLMTVTSVTMYGLRIRMWSVSVFVTPFGLFHVHLIPAFF